MLAPAFDKSVMSSPTHLKADQGNTAPSKPMANSSAIAQRSGSISFQLGDTPRLSGFYGNAVTAGFEERDRAQHIKADYWPRGGMGSFKQFIRHCFGAQRPPRPDPIPSWPGHGFGSKSNAELSRMLLDRFDDFKEPHHPGIITKDGLKNMAGKPLTGDYAKDQNILLARELMKRGDLVDDMDRHHITGGLDGLIDRNNLNITMFENQNDNALTRELMRDVDLFKDPQRPGHLSLEKLHEVANWTVTRHPYFGRQAWLAKELLRRPEMLDRLHFR
ncbi:hypothetical protein [Pseudomonas sp. NIBRBAC000502773]|uniref:hypothetical protein n=1 Tax=Pseudomonas sp. NIBRBAC000502773 TaxID=2590776 RepID=UPI00113009AC|nr:hypothetical protein [Pseudomonas sp. NIBRBAC000502773]QDG55286.1 hypothetical protein NIBR502773_01660 [Pseudomonas sp. NIBRBAC000502773]